MAYPAVEEGSRNNDLRILRIFEGKDKKICIILIILRKKVVTLQPKAARTDEAARARSTFGRLQGKNMLA
jgi:hypothetical protein